MHLFTCTLTKAQETGCRKDTQLTPKTRQLSEHGRPPGHLDVCVGVCDFHKQIDSLPFPEQRCHLGPQVLT